MRYFSLSGEMSDKLSRCRKELTAAIDRAMEDLSVPSPASPDSTTDQNFDLQTAQLSSPHNADLLSHKGEPTPSVYCPQSSLPVSSVPEKENPLFKPNLIPLTIASNITCTKREPLTSKENTWLHPPIFMADRQFFISPEDNERWRKGHLSKTDERPVKSETSITAGDVPPQSLKDLANTSDNSAVWSAERLHSKTDLENELHQMSKLSSELFPPDEASVLDLSARTSFRKVLEHTLEDEAIIETLLDMEEDYKPNSSTLQQLH
ncbi:uncharacterized protein C3orf62 homolog [Rhineura floridana]|uniref:uncharacterized protein C3orf62 homolog n=1 Tax=Rhineura floridana TaxID=261503 RepID=UPI002AC841F7|nr:uncharacterized protein C3orf62 homolog [Rhineura floridana]